MLINSSGENNYYTEAISQIGSLQETAIDTRAFTKYNLHAPDFTFLETGTTFNTMMNSLSRNTHVNTMIMKSAF